MLDYLKTMIIGLPTDFADDFLEDQIRVRILNETNATAEHRENDKSHQKMRRNTWQIKELEKIRLEEKRSEMISLLLNKAKEDEENDISSDDEEQDEQKQQYLVRVDSVEAKLNDMEHQAAAEETYVETVERRLKQLWEWFDTPPDDRITMALKYTDPTLDEAEVSRALEQWENVRNTIAEREQLIVEIYEFESSVAKLTRLSENDGHRHDSHLQMQHSAKRRQYTEHMLAIEARLNPVLVSLLLHFDDRVMFKGQLYREKMHYDMAKAIETATSETVKTTESAP